jgi:type VI secretion system secreted protein VgrG
VIQGTQSAVVVGPPGEEIHTDKYGRIKVQFHWDRHAKGDDSSSCWIRVAQIAAGGGFGSIHIPRVGQEVVVQFEEGDPDRPIVVGCVYNPAQMAPYKLPAHKMISGLRTNTYPGGGGMNEITVDDSKGKERMYLHAQHNQDTVVLHDRTADVKHDDTETVGRNQSVTIIGDRAEKVNGEENYRVQKNRLETVAGERHLVVEKQSLEKIGGAKHVHVVGDHNQKTDGAVSLTVGSSFQEKTGTKHAVEAGQEIHLKAGMKVILEAGVQLTIKGPGGFVDIGPSGVTIQGTMVLINSGGAAGNGSGSSPTAPAEAKHAK